MNRLLVAGIFCVFFSLHLNAQLVQPQFSTPTPLKILNTFSEESFPVPYNNGESMYFVRTEFDNKGSVQQIWHTTQKDGKWLPPIKMDDEFNALSNSAVIGVSANGETIYLFYSVETPRKSQRGISYSTKDENGWTKPKKLNIPGFEIDNGFYSFFISPSEDYLLISMAPNDTTLNEDIYVSKKVNGEWQEIVSLGNHINTSGYEISPYLFSDDKTLYFSSNGHGGLGDADIFTSKRLDDTWKNWTKPVHLDAPINSPAFDAYFVIGTGNDVYFTSNRDSMNSDIYQAKLVGMRSLAVDSFKLTKGEYIVNGLPVAGVRLNILDENGNIIGEVVTDEEGKFNYEILSADVSYSIELADGQDESLENGNIFILNDKGERKFSYRKLSSGKYELNEMELLDEEGVFLFNGEPQKNIKLEILDQDGNVVDIVYTDNEGKFNYQTLNMDSGYLIRVAEEDRDRLSDALIYTIDKEGNKILRYKKLPLGVYTLEPLEFEEGELVEGTFTYKNLPYSNKALVIYDENDVPMDTIYSDSLGVFSYRKLQSDKSFYIKPLNEENPELLSLELKSVSGNIAFDKEGNAFVFKNKDKQTKKVEKDIVQNKIKSQTEGIIYFGFNKYNLSDKSKKLLDQFYEEVSQYENLNILLKGHTDSIGSKSINVVYSRYRANAAKKYLINKGIKPSRIQVQAKGESEPLIENSTPENRAKNRRVEIVVE